MFHTVFRPSFTKFCDGVNPISTIFDMFFLKHRRCTAFWTRVIEQKRTVWSPSASTLSTCTKTSFFQFNFMFLSQQHLAECVLESCSVLTCCVFGVSRTSHKIYWCWCSDQLWMGCVTMPVHLWCSSKLLRCASAQVCPLSNESCSFAELMGFEHSRKDRVWKLNRCKHAARLTWRLLMFQTAVVCPQSFQFPGCMIQSVTHVQRHWSGVLGVTAATRVTEFKEERCTCLQCNKVCRAGFNWIEPVEPRTQGLFALFWLYWLIWMLTGNLIFGWDPVLFCVLSCLHFGHVWSQITCKS